MSFSFDYKEADLHQAISPEFDFTAREQRGKRVYIINWDDLAAAKKEILGYPTFTPEQTIQRVLPMKDPTVPVLLGESVNIKGIDWASNDTSGSDGKRNEYSKALVTVRLNRPAYYIGEDDSLSSSLGREFDRFVEISGNLEGDYLSIGAMQGLLKWASGQAGLDPQEGVPFPESVGKILAYANLTMKWHQIPYDALPYVHIIEALGTINNATFGSLVTPSDLTRQWGRHELLFLGATWDRILLADDSFGWDVTYIFKHNPNIWNFYYNPLATAPAFYQATTNGVFYDPGTVTALPSGRATYNEYNFYKLFDIRDSV